MKPSTLITALVAVLIIGGIVWMVNGRVGDGQTTTTSEESQLPTSTDSQSTTSASTSTQTSTSTATPGTRSVAIANFAFSPNSVTVKKGTRVTWTNQDSVAHTVTGDNGGPASGNITNGQSYSYTFDTVGTFDYHCTPHPNMKATVIVTE